MDKEKIHLHEKVLIFLRCKLGLDELLIVNMIIHLIALFIHLQRCGGYSTS